MLIKESHGQSLFAVTTLNQFYISLLRKLSEHTQVPNMPEHTQVPNMSEHTQLNNVSGHT